jgi:pimeloyl-ACP methyl ester carboxylesterase
MSPRPALILIPGLLCDATVWKEQIEAFASTHEVIVPMLDGLDSIPGMAAAVLERAPPEFSLAGHSLGGRIALEAIRQAPARVTRLALLDTGVHPCGAGEPERRRELLSTLSPDARGCTRLAAADVHPRRHRDVTVMALEAMVERRTPRELPEPGRRAQPARRGSDACPIRCRTRYLGREDG